MREFQRLVILVVLSCFSCGCASPAEKKAVNSVIDIDRLKRGGNLLIVPFRAGAGVAATADLDRTALSIVQGLADTLQNSSASFKILTDENADQAELILKGHIIKMEESKGIKKWMGGKKYLAAQSGISDQKTNELIANFDFSALPGDSKTDYKKLGYQIGEQIG